MEGKNPYLEIGELCERLKQLTKEHRIGLVIKEQNNPEFGVQILAYPQVNVSQETSNQISLEGEKRKKRGLKSVSGNNTVWLQRARAIASDIYQRKGSVTTDDVKDYILRHQLPQPSHPNAWGAIFHAKGWRPIGRTKSKFSAAHAREIRVWGNAQIELPFVTIEGEDPEPFV
jgi:hypothetical protein